VSLIPWTCEGTVHVYTKVQDIPCVHKYTNWNMYTVQKLCAM